MVSSLSFSISNILKEPSQAAYVSTVSESAVQQRDWAAFWLQLEQSLHLCCQQQAQQPVCAPENIFDTPALRSLQLPVWLTQQLLDALTQLKTSSVAVAPTLHFPSSSPPANNNVNSAWPRESHEDFISASSSKRVAIPHSVLLQLNYLEQVSP